MTEKERQLALYCLKAYSDYHSEVCEECIKYPNCDHTIQDDITETIIKALEQEPCEDCIARQPLIDNWNSCADMLMGECDSEVVMGRVFDAPSVTPKGITITDFADKCRECGKQKMGHWIDKTRQSACGVIFYNIECSECGEPSGLSHTLAKYCPNCGAKMESEE